EVISNVLNFVWKKLLQFHRIELIRANTGGYFQSVKTAEVAIYVTVSRIEKNKCKEPLPLVKSALYELKQMFVKKFYGQTQFS
nr:hypothetical protein [Thermodesulfovibrio thiophilus]